MQSDFLDRKLYKMAEQEQMAISEDLDARVDDILQHLEKSGRGSRHHYLSLIHISEPTRP